MIKANTATEEGGSIATIPDFTGLMSQGEFYFGIVTKQGIALKDDLSEVDWRHLLKTALDLWEGLHETHLGMTAKVADILNWGEEHLGEKYANEIDLTRNALRQKAKTIENWQGVFKRVPPHIRNMSLTYEHHSAVAKLTHDEQREFLTLAEKDGLNTHELRAAIKERHPSKPRANKKAITHTDNATSALQKLIDVGNWLKEQGREFVPGAEWKGPAEDVYKLYRRHWMNGHKKA